MGYRMIFIKTDISFFGLDDLNMDWRLQAKVQKTGVAKVFPYKNAEFDALMLSRVKIRFARQPQIRLG